MSSNVREVILQAEAEGHTNLYLNYRNIRDLPVALLASTGVKKLFLKGNRLRELSPDIWKLSHLVELFLHSNDLQRLPAEIGQLSCLQSLDVSNNLLKELTPAVGGLHSLTSLHMGNNQVKCLPREIGNLEHLRVLDVTNNLLEWLPCELGYCASLENLSVDGNRIQSIPQELRRLQRLKEFSVSRNLLVSLPQDVAMLNELVSLLLDSNTSLDVLPATLLRMKNLKVIGLNSCHSRSQNDEESDLKKVIPGIICFQGTASTPVLPLSSLCLRAAYQNGLRAQVRSLPSHLERLVTSPTGHCVECRRPYFTAVYSMLVHASIATRIDPEGGQCIKGQELNNVRFVYCCCSWVCLRRVQSMAAPHLPPL